MYSLSTLICIGNIGFYDEHKWVGGMVVKSTSIAIISIFLAALSLFGFPSVSEAEITKCDRLAAHTLDPNKVADGTPWANLNPSKAIPACERALSRSPNNPTLMFQLGRSFDKAKKYDEAFKWYRKAVKQDYPASRFNLGIMYGEGKSITRNYEEAARWYHKAAKQKYVPAQDQLGKMFYFGNGVT